jgi:hypothetical protein
MYTQYNNNIKIKNKVSKQADKHGEQGSQQYVNITVHKSQVL